MLEELWTYIVNEFLTNDIFSGAALASVVMSAFYQLRDAPKKIYSRLERHILYRVNVYQYTELFLAIEDYMAKYHKGKYRNVEASFVHESPTEGDYLLKDSVSNDRYDNIKDTDKDVSFTHFEDNFLLWHKGIFPIKVTKGREKLENAHSLKHAYLTSFQFTTIFGKKTIQSFLNAASEDYVTSISEKTSSRVYSNSWREWNYLCTYKKNLDNVIIPEKDKKTLIQDIEQFKSMKNKYDKLDIPYKRTYLLHGAPGNGKTSLATGIAGYLKLDIAYLNLRTVDSDENLQSLFKNLPSQCLLAIEDIDASFKGREPLGKVTFSGLLNCLDGVFFKDKLITVITTNHIDKLDPALIRKGRVDFSLELKNPTKTEVEKYLSTYYNDNVELTKFSENVCMSQIVDICLKNDKDNCVNIIEQGAYNE